MTVSEVAIDVQGLKKSFGDHLAVKDISLKVNKGTICGFIGPNGSGKTTTIRMLCGLLTPDEGKGSCLGYDILLESLQIKQQVGYMPQKFGIYDDLSVKENLWFIARIYQVPHPEQAISEVISRLGLERYLHSLAGTMSGGWKQRLALAGCLLHKPKLLILDEPTAGVDPQARRDFWSELHQLAAEGMTILVSTHYMDEAERCHHLVYVSSGRVLTSGTAVNLLKYANLRTWEVTAIGLASISEVLAVVERCPLWIAVPFGAKIHITGERNTEFIELSQLFSEESWKEDICIREVDPNLEDVFLALLRQSSSIG